MFCINCGAEVNGRFCPNCGTRQPDIAASVENALNGVEETVKEVVPEVPETPQETFNWEQPAASWEQPEVPSGSEFSYIPETPAPEVTPVPEAPVPEVPPVYEAPKYEAPQPEAVAPEVPPVYEVPKYEAPQPEAPAPEVPPVYEAPKYEAPQPEAPAPEGPRPSGADFSYIPPEPPKPAAPEKPKKERGPKKAAPGGIKKLLPIILVAVLAVALVVGVIAIFKSCGGSGKKSSGSRVLVMQTEKGAWLVGDEEHELVPKGTGDVFFNAGQYVAFYTKSGKLYFNNSKGEEQIAKNVEDILAYSYDQGCVVYRTEDGEVFAWNSKDKKELETGIEDTVYVSGAQISAGGKYAALIAVNDDYDYVLYTIDMAKGTATEIAEEVSEVEAIADDGTVYWTSDDQELLTRAGKKDVTLAEDVMTAYVFAAEKKILYINDDGDLLLRGTGEKDKEETVAEDVISIMPVYDVGPMYAGYGLAVGFSLSDYSLFENLIVFVNDDDEAWVLSLKSGKAALLYDGKDDPEAILFRNDSSAYIVAGGKLLSGKSGKDKWSFETVSKKAGDIIGMTSSGSFIFMDGSKVYFFDGKNETELASKVETSANQIAVADNGKSMAYIQDGTLYYVSKAGEKGEKLVKKVSPSSSVFIEGGKIYYLTEDAELCRIATKGGDPEVIAEDIESFDFMYK